MKATQAQIDAARANARFAAKHDGNTMTRKGTKMVLRGGVWVRA